ncbi:10749_t:CDS:2 [Paraglomus occultum]|uniref:10749_t:CDS:1 n=1 Tax=Paraglomus occultum TaxID=144539 RepID=A0A9N8VQX8_9GLOM|nr:10749_t:CDS:2 [Paraglomus occultum]
MKSYNKQGREFDNTIKKLLRKKGVKWGRWIAYKDIQRFEGALSGVNKEVTVAIMVARSKKGYTKNAIDRANRAKQSAGYNIILTDEKDLYSDLIEYIESNGLDGSNKALKEELKEIHLEAQRLGTELQQLRSEIAELRDLVASYLNK